MYCRNCGYAQRGHARFCPNCGAKYEPELPAAAVSAPDPALVETARFGPEDLLALQGPGATAPGAVQTSDADAGAAAQPPSKPRHKYYHPGFAELLGAALLAIVLTAGSLFLARSHEALGFWTVGRIAGFLVYGLLTVAVALGLFMALRWRTFGPAWLMAERLHPILLLTAGALLVTHIAGFILIGLPIVAAVIPFTSGFRTANIGLGVLSAYVGILLVASTYVIRLIGYGLWRFLHYLGFVAWFSALIHGLTAGHDSAAPIVLAYYALGALIVTCLVLMRCVRYISSLQPARLRAAATGAGNGT